MYAERAGRDLTLREVSGDLKLFGGQRVAEHEVVQVLVREKDTVTRETQRIYDHARGMGPHASCGATTRVPPDTKIYLYAIATCPTLPYILYATHHNKHKHVTIAFLQSFG